MPTATPRGSALAPLPLAPPDLAVSITVGGETEATGKPRAAAAASAE